MPSQINNLFLNIDQDYPVAGIDNDTQGFRDNFDVIKTSLGFAGQEITALQDTTAKINEGNDFSGNSISNADLVAITHKSFAPSLFDTTSGAQGEIQFRNGNHQRIIIQGSNPSINFLVVWGPTSGSNLDADRYARIVVEITALNPGEEYTVGWFTQFSGDVKYDNRYPVVFKATSTSQFVELSTFNGGNTMFVRYLGAYEEDVTAPADSFTNINVGAVASINSLNVTDAAVLEGEVTLESTLEVGGDSTLTGDLVVQGSTTVESVVANGNITIVGDLTVTGTNNVAISSLSGLTTDVDLSTAPTGGQVLKYNETSSKWEAATDNVTTSLSELTTDVDLSTAPTDGQVLKYNQSSGKWKAGDDNVTTSLSELTTDVEIDSPQDNQVIKYNSVTGKWENAAFEERIVTYAVRIVDGGPGAQAVFEIDGNQIKTSGGLINSFNFEVGVKYIFDLSDTSNSAARLKFSTTPDTEVPASISAFSSGVTEVGDAGTPGALTEIVITDSTPDVLYIYGEEAPGGLDTSGLGRSVPILKVSGAFTGFEILLTDNITLALNRSVSVVGSTDVETSILENGSSGQIKTLIMQQENGNMVVSVARAGWTIGDAAGTITLDGIGKSCTLQYINGNWFCIGNNGAVFA
jgi:hypothetical protein